MNVDKEIEILKSIDFGDDIEGKNAMDKVLKYIEELEYFVGNGYGM